MINGKWGSIKDGVLNLAKAKTTSYDHRWSNNKRQYFNYRYIINKLLRFFNVKKSFWCSYAHRYWSKYMQAKMKS